MKLPAWVLVWLKSYGIAADGVIAEILRLADKLDAPDEWKDRLGVWFAENTTLSAEKILVFVATIYSELTSPPQPVDPDSIADA